MLRGGGEREGKRPSRAAGDRQPQGVASKGGSDLPSPSDHAPGIVDEHVELGLVPLEALDDGLAAGLVLKVADEVGGRPARGLAERVQLLDRGRQLGLLARGDVD